MRRIRDVLAADIPFARDEAHRLLPAMIACLAGFAALLLAVAMTLTGALEGQSRAMQGGLQVEAPEASSATVDKLVAELRRTPGVTRVTPLGEKDMQKLLEPWLGSGVPLDELTLPAIIDVETEIDDGKIAVDMESLRTNLRTIDRQVRVEDRGPWVGQLVQAAWLIQSLVVLVAALLLACVLGMVVLVSRTNLRLHFKAVSLLHLFGATDDYILRQFQWNSALLAGRGALAGVFIAALIFFAAVLLSHQWQNPALPQLSVTFMHIAVFLLLPIFTALSALLATRLTVQSMLSHMH